MAKYEVYVPVVGFVTKYVEAETEEAAIAAALQEDIGEDYEEFGMVAKLSEGNVLNAPLHEAEALLLDEEDDS